MAAGRCGRILLTEWRASPDPSLLFISAISSCWFKWKNCIQACNYAIWRGEEIENCSNLGCWSHMISGIAEQKELPCGVRKECLAAWEDVGILGQTCCDSHTFSASTHAHARHANGSILNHDQSINKWGHFKAWNDCILRWRSHLPWLQEHVLASGECCSGTSAFDCGFSTALNVQMLHLLLVIQLLNLNRDALGLGLGLLLPFLLTWSHVPLVL